VRAAAPAAARRASDPTAGQPAPAVPQPPLPLAARSRMAHALARGTFVVSLELLPPRGHRTDELVDAARQLRIRGVDLVNIPDGPRASGRMSAIATAVLIQQAGVETILHYTCRDRTLLGMQSDLLGAQSMGVRNLLLVTGDPPRIGDYPDATAVFDVDAIGLTNMVASLNRGIDIGGQPIGQATSFHVGVAANPGTLNLEQEVRRFRYKVEAGAEFAITQPVFDIDELRLFLERVADVRIPVLAGILPLGSLRQAEFMANEVPGVNVPESVLERMRVAEGEGRAAAEGVAIAREVVAGVRGLVQGIQITTASGAIDAAIELLDTVEA
jgi:methionine synthase / methylenetetrahydrofolate reductase (NADH)